MHRRFTLPLVLTIFASAFFSACDLDDLDEVIASGANGATDTTLSPTAAPSPDDVATARAQLAGLPTTARSRRSDYERDAFGSAWRDVDGNGCNQRDDVLLRDAVPGTAKTQPQGRCDHDVVAGTWADPYSGRLLELDNLKDRGQAQKVQIDHVVPLAEAWSSGASAWSRDRRSLFANDLGNLLAVDGPTNAAKSADDPASWRPRKQYQCSYAVHWITVKNAWQLKADSSEVKALEEMLATC